MSKLFFSESAVNAIPGLFFCKHNLVKICAIYTRRSMKLRFYTVSSDKILEISNSLKCAFSRVQYDFSFLFKIKTKLLRQEAVCGTILKVSDVCQMCSGEEACANRNLDAMKNSRKG